MQIQHTPHTGLSFLYNIRFGCYDFAATVETVRTDVVAQMGFAGIWLNGKGLCGQCVVCAAHATLGSGFSVLLYSHGITPRDSLFF